MWLLVGVGIAFALYHAQAMRINVESTSEAVALAETNNAFSNYNVIYKPVDLPVDIPVPKSLPPPGLRAATPFNVCSCVSYARWKTGINIGSIGYAKNHPVNLDVPVVGAIGVMTTGSYGHEFVVERLDFLTYHISEYNWKHCAYSERDLPYDYQVKGFYINK